MSQIACMWGLALPFARISPILAQQKVFDSPFLSFSAFYSSPVMQTHSTASWFQHLMNKVVTKRDSHSIRLMNWYKGGLNGSRSSFESISKARSDWSRRRHVARESRAFQEPVRKKINKTNQRERRQCGFVGKFHLSSRTDDSFRSVTPFWQL